MHPTRMFPRDQKAYDNRQKKKYVTLIVFAMLMTVLLGIVYLSAVGG